MLYISSDVFVCKDNSICSLGCKRKATWTVGLDSGEVANVCAHCLMYSGKTKWGIDNREEMLEVGRAAQEQAAKFNKSIQLDERGRLHPNDAEKFMLGVSFTSRVVIDRLGVNHDRS